MNKQIQNIIIDAFGLLIISTIFVTSVNWLFADLKKGKPQHDLTVAILQQDTTGVQKLLSQNAEEQVQFQDDNGRTALMWASYAYIEDPKLFAESQKVRVQMVQHLLENPANSLELRDNDDWTALSWAAWSGLGDIVSILLEKGAQKDVVDKKGNTPLMLAALRGNDTVVDILRKAGADINMKNNDGQTALSIAQEQGSQYQGENRARTISVLSP